MFMIMIIIIIIVIIIIVFLRYDYLVSHAYMICDRLLYGIQMGTDLD